MHHLPHASRLRAGRHSQASAVYHVIATTHARQPLFADLYAARTVIRVLHLEQCLGRAQTLAFVLMPDHLHWLMRLQTMNLSRVVRDVKAVSAHHLGGKVWQTGFFDHAARQEEDIVAMARYIVANPLRAGLVQSLGDYPHWDSIWL